MDFVTWKRSEHFKGKRASVAVGIDVAIIAGERSTALACSL